MNRSVGPLLLLALLLGYIGTGAAQGVRLQHFPLAGHGALNLSVPDGWRVHANRPPDGLPPTLNFTPASGQSFQVLVTVVWPIAPQTLLPNREEIRESVAQAAKEAAPQSVEQVLPLKELRGTNPGYYFFATDKAPKAGEYEYLTQGIIHVGGVNLAFTVLTHDGEEAVIKAALQMLSSAVHRPEGVGS